MKKCCEHNKIFRQSTCLSIGIVKALENSGAITNITAATQVQQNTENAIILLSVSLASFILPAPRSCPTTMATESPSAINMILNTLLMVWKYLIRNHVQSTD